MTLPSVSFNGGWFKRNVISFVMLNLFRNLHLPPLMVHEFNGGLP
ncbi:MAG: hypothetical protein ACTS6G_04505 [Candidatus Hodgkinia cicadicola]